MLPDKETQLVNDIYSYWFEGDLNVNYKTKWFPSGNIDIQKKADNYIYDNYNDVFNESINGVYNHWKKESKKSMLVLILLFDQFSRHIYRKIELDPSDPRRVIADQYGLLCAEELHQANIANFSDTATIAKNTNSISENIKDLNLSTTELIFSMLPFRHSATVSRLQGVMNVIEEAETSLNHDISLLNKFRKQTVRRLQHLQDRERASIKSESIVSSASVQPSSTSGIYPVELEEYDDVLECLAFEADESDIQLTSPGIVKTTIEFVKQFRKHELNTLAVSLSGGVDSMVIIKILVTLRRFEIIPAECRIVALHINYMNRSESTREAEYVEKWCRALNIECFVRTVSEVKRGVTDRNAYEKISRDIRYGFYKETMASINNHCSVEHHVHGVMFGHHIGDIQENVISNVMRGCSPMLLSGMEKSTINHGVCIWRPLLYHHKDEILAFAHKYGVPYMKDSTPSWSTRGKLRNHLMPLLADMYGQGYAHNLTSLASMSDELNVLVQSNIYDPIMKTVQRYPCGLKVSLLPTIRTQAENEKQPSASFWKEVLKQLLHSMGMSMVRETSITNFIERIERFKGVPHRVRGEGDVNLHLTRPTIVRSNELNGNTTSVEQGDIKPIKPVQSKMKQHLVLSGWLELRKGFHTYIDESACFMIFKTNVLVEMINKGGGSKDRGNAKKNKEKTQSQHVQIMCANSPNNNDAHVDSLDNTHANAVDKVLYEKSQSFMNEESAFRILEVQVEAECSHHVVIFQATLGTSGDVDTSGHVKWDIPNELFQYMWCHHNYTSQRSVEPYGRVDIETISKPLMLGFCMALADEAFPAAVVSRNVCDLVSNMKSIEVTDRRPIKTDGTGSFNKMSDSLLQCHMRHFYENVGSDSTGSINAHTISIGNWTIKITSAPHDANNNEMVTIQDTIELCANTVKGHTAALPMDQLLEGRFYYQYKNVPKTWCTLLYIVSSLSTQCVKHINKYCSRLLKPMSVLDPRFKLGLPLLIPLPPEALGFELDSGLESFNSGLDLIFEYVYK